MVAGERGPAYDVQGIPIQVLPARRVITLHKMKEILSWGKSSRILSLH